MADDEEAILKAKVRRMLSLGYTSVTIDSRYFLFCSWRKLLITTKERAFGGS